MNRVSLEAQNKSIKKLLSVVDLMEFSIRMMRQNIVRALPGAGQDIIDAELRRWIFEQPVHFVIGEKSKINNERHPYSS